MRMTPNKMPMPAAIVIQMLAVCVGQGVHADVAEYAS